MPNRRLTLPHPPRASLASTPAPRPPPPRLSLPPIPPHSPLASVPVPPSHLRRLRPPRPPRPSAAASTPCDPSPSSSTPMEKISVAVRFRPTAPTSSDDSSTSGGDREWRIDNTRISLLHRAAPVPGASFSFDHVFNETATNVRIYGMLVRSLILAAVDGFNGTAFAYGQTSSGKTFTMNGSGDHPGIIPLAVRDVFDTAREAADREFLTLGSQKLPIHESLDRSVYVAGLQEEIVNSAEQVFELLELGKLLGILGRQT